MLYSVWVFLIRKKIQNGGIFDGLFGTLFVTLEVFGESEDGKHSLLFLLNFPVVTSCLIKEQGFVSAKFQDDSFDEFFLRF